MIEKVLVANRGEIAIRVMRACRELGIKSVAVYSDADKDALFVKYADEAYYLGATPASQSYLNIDRIMHVVRECGADAVHPGYGFLSQNPDFAYACEVADISFIGPSSKILTLMGNKLAARREVMRAGVPVVPGSDGPVTEYATARDVAYEVGYPIIIKPAAGGGGIGMFIVNNDAELKDALESARRLALSTFGLVDVYIEKYIVQPRHIEFQIIADNHGNIVSLGERECSIQRRHQKLIEETPSPALTPELRREMAEMAITTARCVGYRNAGTVETIFSNGTYYFLEMNTRIQVEHAITEMVTGIDIVKEQILIANGSPLSFTQEDIQPRGWAIECRINAEDPFNDFAPSPGKLSGYRSPGGVGVRVDSGVHTRYSIPPLYDPMISKLVVWGRNRDEAIKRMRRALYEYIIVGVKTNIPFHKAVMENPRFISGNLGTHFIEEEVTLIDEMKRITEREQSLEEKLSTIFDTKGRVAAIAAAAVIAQMFTPPPQQSEEE